MVAGRSTAKTKASSLCAAARDRPPATAAPQATAATADARLIIHNQYLKDLSFENPGGPARLAELQQGPDIKVDIKVDSRHLEERHYEVELSFDVSAKVKERTAFLVELCYVGVVTIGEKVEEAHVDPLLRVEAPRYLFPFARNILADVTRTGGFPPLLINPIDFAQMYLRQQAAAAPPSGTA
jgi:preprotein translocase subunit SecB